MTAKGLNPILNVSDIQQSVAWFEKLGWKKHWDWGSPPTFGAVCSGQCEIFLCLDGQGGRGKSALPTTSGEAEAADKGVWISIWVEDVDAVYQHCGRRRLRPGVATARPSCVSMGRGADRDFSAFASNHLRHQRLAPIRRRTGTVGFRGGSDAL